MFQCLSPDRFASQHRGHRFIRAILLTIAIAALAAGCGGGDSGAVGAVSVSTVPGAPILSTVTGGDASASVVFSAPSVTGGSAILSYAATCVAPGSSRTVTGISSPIVFTGLLNGVLYACSVTATNSVGVGPASTALAVTPAANAATLSTASILCSYADSGTQSLATRGTNAASPTVQILPFTYSWGCSGSSRTLTSNGIPNHSFSGGNFATAISPQVTGTGTPSISVTYTLTPALASATSAPQFAGYSINGLKLEPGTAGTCTDAGLCNEAGGGSGTWRMEALSANKWDFGVDSNHSHVQPTGEYHIHGMPENLMAKLAKGQAMTLVGWAADGFPIYARYGYTNPNDPKSVIKTLTGSWRTKAVPDAGRPAISLYAMGSFRQDWEYVAGSGDLDECNGRTGVTPEFPSGIYYYAITDTYPFIHRCVKGVVSGSGGPAAGGPGLPPPLPGG